jgi:hypothetical protein
MVLTDVPAMLAANPGLIVLDTARLTNERNPLTFATYEAQFEAYIGFAAHTADGAVAFNYRCFALDAAGAVIQEIRGDDRGSIKANSKFDSTVTGAFKSTTVPIHRVVVFMAAQTGFVISESLEATVTKSKVTALEETSDIPARYIHTCVLEGLNAGATININSTAVLTGVADSTNVFIGAANDQSDAFAIDTNAVNVFMSSISRVMPRAFTSEGHQMLTRTVTGMYNDESVGVAFQAMSFSDVQRAVKRVGKVAKMAKSELEHYAPMIEDVGAKLSLLPGPVGTVGSAMRMSGRAMQ